MADFLQTLLNAVTIGSLLALVALGYTMVYGILKLINFAHSDVVVLGAWTSVTLAVVLLPRLGVGLDGSSVPPVWAGVLVLVLAMMICGGVGFLIERLAYKPIRKAPRLNALITAIGVSLLLQNVGQLQYTIIDNQSRQTSGLMQERGTDARTIRLGEPIEFVDGVQYAIRVYRIADIVRATEAIGHPEAEAWKRYVADRSGSVMPSLDLLSDTRLRLSPRTVVPEVSGRFEAGSDIAIAQPIGRSETRDAVFELYAISPHPPLKLPFGAMPQRIPELLPQKTLVERAFATEIEQVDGTVVRIEKPLRITLLDLVIVGTAVILMLLLELLVYRTKVGRAMRALSYNMETAQLMGIPVNRIVSLTFVIGAMLAAAAGFLYALKYTQIQQPAHTTWVLLGLKAFVAAVVGGIGNLRGAVVGGFLIAFIEQFGAYLGQQAGWQNSSAYTDVFAFVLLIIVLLVRPAGLFGSAVREKV